MYSDSIVFKPLLNNIYVCTLELITLENQNYINFCNSYECQVFAGTVIEIQITSNNQIVSNINRNNIVYDEIKRVMNVNLLNMMKNNYFYPIKKLIYDNRINNLIDDYNNRKDLINFLKHHNVELGKLQNIDYNFLKTFNFINFLTYIK